jgi:ubiquinol-cytochrome c reductase core subunit 2
VLNEEVLPLIQAAHQRFLANPAEIAINSAHSLAFHRGLGTPTASASTTPFTKYLDADTLEYFSKIAFAKSNFAVVANGADHGEFSGWVNQFFENVPAKPVEELNVGTQQTQYHGGEERIAHAGGNAIAIGFPGSSSFTGKSYKPEIAVLASLLGGQSSIKWSPGFSVLGQSKASPSTYAQTTSAIYSDAGLLYTLIVGSAQNVAATAATAVEAIKKIAGGEITKEQIAKAKATAKFKELEHGQDIRAGLELTGSGLVHGNKSYQIDEVAKGIDGVTEESVKAVSIPNIIQISHSVPVLFTRILTFSCRPPSHYSRARLPYHQSVICSCCHMLRISASRCKYRRLRKSVRWI